MAPNQGADGRPVSAAAANAGEVDAMLLILDRLVADSFVVSEPGLAASLRASSERLGDAVAGLRRELSRDPSDGHGLGLYVALASRAARLALHASKRLESQFPDAVAQLEAQVGRVHSSAVVVRQHEQATAAGDHDRANGPIVSPVEAPGVNGHGPARIDVPWNLRDDESNRIRYLLTVPGVVLIVEGDWIAARGWPDHPIIQRRDALIAYLSAVARTGPEVEVVFDSRMGDGRGLTVAEGVCVRLTSHLATPQSAVEELIATYSPDRPIVVMTDDTALRDIAARTGCAVVASATLLDYFVSAAR